MSILAMKSARFVSPLLVFGSILCLIVSGGCTREPTDFDLPIGRTVIEALGVPPKGPHSYLEITARPPGSPAWKATLRKDSEGAWRFEMRSDALGETGDLADTNLVDHFVELVGTFTTEEAAPNGNDAVFGLNPYRMEIRLGAPNLPSLQLGEPTGATGLYFRIGPKGNVRIGRGALITYLETLDSAEAIGLKSPYRASLPEFISVRLRKHHGKDRGEWEFLRADGRWFIGKSPLEAGKASFLERVFRQRLFQVLPVKDLPDLVRPDWTLTVRTPLGEETLALHFHLNSVFAKNLARSNRALELYPEMAGALRAFTQARFTPVKSGTK